MTLEQILTEKVQEAVKNLYGIEVNEQQVQLQKTRPEFEGDITLVVFPFVKAARKARIRFRATKKAARTDFPLLL